MFDQRPWFVCGVMGLWLIAIQIVVLSAMHYARQRKQRQRALNTAKCPTLTGRVERILDGAALAAAACRTGRIPEPSPFVAHFLISSPEGMVAVEPGPALLVGLDEVHVGDLVQVQGPLAKEGVSYRGGEAVAVFRGTSDCPLKLSRP